MGTPHFWYYPAATRGALSVIDIGRPVSALEEKHDVERVDARALSGRISSTVQSEATGIILEIADLPPETASSTAADLIRNLRNLELHLQRGGVVSFALDEAKAWASYAPAPVLGARTLQTRGNVWGYSGQNDTAFVEDGDELAVSVPGRAPEYALVESGGDPLTLASALTTDHRALGGGDPVLVRWRDYYPSLRLPPGASPDLLTCDRRIRWRFSCELIEDVATLYEMRGVAPGFLVDTSGSGAGWPERLSEDAARRAGVSGQFGPSWRR